MSKKHKFSHTEVEYMDDGSGTAHHVHESDPTKDVKHAFGDLDGLHDSIQEHLNPEMEESLEEKIHPGIHDEVMQLADEGKK